MHLGNAFMTDSLPISDVLPVLFDKSTSPSGTRKYRDGAAEEEEQEQANVSRS